MQPDFWKARWEAGQIGFHIDEPNPELVAADDRFLHGGPHRVLVPLCGKSVDLDYLARRGHDVVGVELVRSAVDAVFSESGRLPEWQEVQGGMRARSGNLTVYQGDLFALDPAVFTGVTRIWDRAALIALHPSQRAAYAALIRSVLAPGGKMLLNVLQYDQAVMDGPPWSVDDGTVRALYPGVEKVRSRDALDARWSERGHQSMTSSTWLLDASA